MYRFSLLQVPEEVRRITRSLVLIIAENGMIFRIDSIFQGVSPHTVNESTAVERKTRW